jgi:mercuric reductase
MVVKGGTATLIHLGLPEGLPIGGCCLNVGCVPSKYLIRAAEQVHQMQHARFPGITPRGADVDTQPLLEDMRRIIADLRKRNYEDPLPETEGIELIQGRGVIRDAYTVEVDGRSFTGDAVLVATGSRPDLGAASHLPPDRVLSNETLFGLDRLPESVLVLGGGYVAVEMAQALHRLGVQVTQLQRSAHLFSSEPAYLGEALADRMLQEGVNLHCGVNVTSLETGGDGVIAKANVNGQERSFSAQTLLMARGRLGNTTNLFAQDLGVKLSPSGYIQVDGHLETGCPGIYAVGDVLGGHMLVYTASAEAERVVARLHGEPAPGWEPSSVPWVVFSDPQLGGVGRCLEEAQAQGIPVEEAVLPTNRWPRFSTLGQDNGFLKLFRNPESDLLLGARALCPEAGDLMSELGLILRHRIPLRDIAGTLYPYLTLSEGIQRCADRFYS